MAPASSLASTYGDLGLEGLGRVWGRGERGRAFLTENLLGRGDAGVLKGQSARRQAQRFSFSLFLVSLVLGGRVNLICIDQWRFVLILFPVGHSSDDGSCGAVSHLCCNP